MFIPGQRQINMQMMPGPNATPATIIEKDATGNVEIIQAGGLTKLEQGALMIAASMASVNVAEDPSGDAAAAVEFARVVLAECAARQASAVPNNGSR